MKETYAAPIYTSCKDLWIVTSFFNPGNYQTKLINYNIFQNTLKRSGLNLLTVECAFGEKPFCLDTSDNVMHVRSPDILWQKERLLNIAIQNLPNHVKKVACIDFDILFNNPDWAVQTSHLLDIFPVVQPFETVVRLPKGHNYYDGMGEEYHLVRESFGYVHVNKPEMVSKGSVREHGHPGYAWAFNREVFSNQILYDACISGSGDDLIAHALCGEFNHPCVQRILNQTGPYKEHYLHWGKNIYNQVRSKLTYTPGIILHLWHGAPQDRKYDIRDQELKQFGFDPDEDLKIGAESTWEWKRGNIDLEHWAINYFDQRKEDGNKG